VSNKISPFLRQTRVVFSALTSILYSFDSVSCSVCNWFQLWKICHIFLCSFIKWIY